MTDLLGAVISVSSNTELGFCETARLSSRDTGERSLLSEYPYAFSSFREVLHILAVGKFQKVFSPGVSYRQAPVFSFLTQRQLGPPVLSHSKWWGHRAGVSLTSGSNCSWPRSVLYLLGDHGQDTSFSGSTPLPVLL